MAYKEWVYSFKRAARVLIDIFLFALSLVISYKLRLEHNLSFEIQNWYWSVQMPFILGIAVSLRLSFLLIFQIYNKMWRYTEINEILELSKPIVLSSLILSIPRILGYKASEYIFAVPVSVIVMDSCLSLIFLSSARLLRKWQISARSIRKRQKESAHKPKKRTLLIGAGQAAQELLRKVHEHPELDLEIVCAIDDSLRKQNMTLINNIKVVGEIKDLGLAVSKHHIDQIIIAIPSLVPKKLREIIELCQKTNLETKTIPGVDQLAGGQVTVEQIRKVSLEDLLGREPVDLSIPEVSNFINSKTILITGAGGSIGSEITKQLIRKFQPKKIYILGRGENSIFQLSQELTFSGFTNFTPIICDIRNYKLLHSHILKASPDVIFHGAAHKHVPLMEDHPKEAFENNSAGTENIAKIAGLLNIETFVNISTDKAVNPINVLGCTKRIAELIVNSCSKKYIKTKYISVRFGNVIGSRGSVIPTWQAQLKNSLPITITSKDAYRFFMTTQEAAQLVIKAGAIGNSGEIMVLDMGKEVNIYELAKDFVRLSGYDPELVKINTTGLRAGEKLREELVNYYEGTNLTKHKKILVIEQKENPSSSVETVLNELLRSVENVNEEDFKKKLLFETRRLNELRNKTLLSV